MLLMGKSTISMAMASIAIYVCLPGRVVVRHRDGQLFGKFCHGQVTWWIFDQKFGECPSSPCSVHTRFVRRIIDSRIPPVGPVLVPNGVMTCDDKGTPDYPMSFDHAMCLGKL